MRASSLIHDILVGCGVSDNAAQAMETIAEQLLDGKDFEVCVEVNEAFDKDFIVQRDCHDSLCLKIEVRQGDLE
jgi:hypothetical protein